MERALSLVNATFVTAFNVPDDVWKTLYLKINQHTLKFKFN